MHMANPLRDPDDSYDFPTVPRFAELGKQDNQDANTTLGDRFFDLIPQDKTVKMEMRGDGSTGNNSQIVSSAKDCKNGGEETPFGMNNLAMFRPPSRTNIMNERSDKKDSIRASTEDKRVPLKNLKINGEECGKPSAAARRVLQIALKVKEESEPAKTARLMDQKSLKDKRRFRSVERHVDKGPGGAKRSASSEPMRQRNSCKVTPRINTNLLAARAAAKAEISKRKGPVRVVPNNRLKTTPKTTSRISSTYCSKSNDKDTITEQQNASNMKKSANKNSLAATTRNEPYSGPETRARARLRTRNDSQTRIKNEIRQPTFKKQSAEGVQKEKAIDRRTEKENVVGCFTKDSNYVPKYICPSVGHMSRPRTRGAVGCPIRVKKTDEMKNAANDSLPPLKSARDFRRSIERRPKGGDSLERNVDDKKGNVAAKPKMEFAPCLRRQATATGSPKLHRRSDNPDDILAARKKTVANAPPRRRTAAEREAFFRRLSTPKKVTPKVASH